jgi:predicted RND superfamily exporter protein
MHANEMKRLLQIFDLSKNEQRVVLIVMLVLVVIALIGYERRVHRVPVQATPPTQSKASQSATRTGDGE